MPEAKNHTCPAVPLLAAMRPHQWAKNLLVFLPMALAHHMDDPRRWIDLATAFAALCALASSVYLINDLFDLSADRRHPLKRHRPCASGRLGVVPAGAAAGALACTAFATAAVAVPAVLPMLLGYFALTFLYSLAFKRVPLVDVVCLALLYMARLGIGGAAARVPVSYWLTGFAFLVFTSLAFAKRHSEIAARRGSGAEAVPGRGYAIRDRAFVFAAGAAAGAGAMAVFFLYATLSSQARLLYGQPLFLHAAGAVLSLWMVRLWRLAARNRLDEDPVRFAIRDPFSWLSAALVAGLFYLAA